MSQGERIPFEQARAMAEALVDFLRPACERIEIAGSIRRCRPEVGDIEIVAIPRIEDQIVGLFPDQIALVNALEERLRGTVSRRDVSVHRQDGSVETQKRDGASYKALEFQGFPVDLFITTADQWGVIFGLRTGPGDWNVRLVEDCKRYNRRVEGGRVLHLGRPVATPEERDFFAAIGQPWIEPAERRVERVAIRNPSVPA